MTTSILTKEEIEARKSWAAGIWNLSSTVTTGIMYPGGSMDIPFARALSLYNRRGHVVSRFLGDRATQWLTEAQPISIGEERFINIKKVRDFFLN